MVLFKKLSFHAYMTKRISYWLEQVQKTSVSYQLAGLTLRGFARKWIFPQPIYLDGPCEWNPSRRIRPLYFVIGSFHTVIRSGKQNAHENRNVQPFTLKLRVQSARGLESKNLRAWPTLTKTIGEGVWPDVQRHQVTYIHGVFKMDKQPEEAKLVGL